MALRLVWCIIIGDLHHLHLACVVQVCQNFLFVWLLAGCIALPITAFQLLFLPPFL
jgi:hypothetical protein